MSQPEDSRPKVLIVGAGPSGLALAIELGHRDVPCLVVENNDRVGYAPRAKTTHVRMREHMRRWGIADKLAEASPLGIDYPSNIAFITRLNGYPLSKIENAFNCSPRKNPLYAEHAQWIPQYTLEKVMLEHAQSLPNVEVRFNCQHRSFEQVGNKIFSVLREKDADEDIAVETDYLVGADGSRSRIREAIGVTMNGESNISRHHNIIFRAPGLAERHNHGHNIMYWQVNEDMPSLIGPMDQGDTWFFMPPQSPSTPILSDDDAVKAIRQATGIDLPYEILSSDEWIANSLIADRYSLGRVYLTGDASHLHPPFGGFGMFLGVLDSIDLGWKMAAILNGYGAPSLLDSYECERKNIHEYVVAEAVENHKSLPDKFVKPGIEEVGATGDKVRAEVGAWIKSMKEAEFCTLGVVLGCRYENSPLIVSDGTTPPPQSATSYLPSASPGCRAPHAWLDDGSSLYDNFGKDFTLLVMGNFDAVLEQCVQQQSQSAGVPVDIVFVDDSAISDLYQARFILIRPDQHIAWRGGVWPDRAEAIFRQVVGFEAA